MSDNSQTARTQVSSHSVIANSPHELSALINKIRTLAINELTEKLNRMLDTADDKLFDMADKSNEVMIFNSMRQMRIKRKGLVNTFTREIDHAFSDRLGQSIVGGLPNNVESLSFENLSLVQDDDLEEDLAIDGMVNKGRSKSKIALDHICSRLDVLVSNKQITQDLNPIDPRVIAEAFRTSSRGLELDTKSRLVVFKMFERCVVDEFEEFYDEINEEFADQGILPDLHKRKPRRAQHAEQSKSSGQRDSRSKEELRDEVREEVFNTLRDLLGNRKVSYSEDTKVVETDELVDALTNLQKDVGYTRTDLSTPDQVKQVLSGFLPATNGQINGGTIGNINDDVIDIVTMLFDFILDDRNLHNDIKAVLARLQIPMLKVGLVDRKFFSERSHPARKLLNELSHAGIGWIPADKKKVDPLLKKITDIVETITTKFKDDVSIFETLLEDFELFRSQDNRRQTILERRIKEAEEGRAKANTARKTVNAEISRICHGRLIVEPVKNLLKEVWTNVLFLEQLKPHNEDGWAKALKVAEFLIWSVQPKPTQQEKDKLTKVMTSLIKNLRLGMAKVSFSDFRSSQLLSQLEEYHREILAMPLREELEGNLIHQIPNSSSADVEEVTEETLVELTLPVEESTQSTTQAEHPLDDLEPLYDETHPVFEVVAKIQSGTWVEISDHKQNKQRAKLAAYIASANKYIFVNRTGIKVAELTRELLASGLNQSFISVLDDAALFDRALESVITNLRSMKQTAEAV